MKNILVSPFRSGGNGTKQVAAALLSPTPQVKRSDPPPHNIFTNNSLFALPKFAVHTPPLSKVSLFPSMKSHSNCIGSLINPPTADRRFVFVKEKEESEPTQSTSSQKSSTKCFYGIFLTDSGNEGLLIQPLRHSPRTGQSNYLAWEGHLRLVKPENVTFIQMTSTPFGYQLQGPNQSITPLDETDLITLEDLSDLEEETSLCNEGHEKFSSSPVITAERSNDIFTTPLKDTTIVLSALSTNNTTIASFTPNSAIGEDELYWKEEDDVGYWPDLPPLVPTKLFEDDSPLPRKRKSSSSSAKRRTKKQKN